MTFSSLQLHKVGHTNLHEGILHGCIACNLVAFDTSWGNGHFEVRHLTYFFLNKKPLLASRSKQSILLQFHVYLFSRLMFIFAYNNYLLALIWKPLFFTNIPRHVGLHGMQIYTAVRCGFGTHLLELHSCSCWFNKNIFFQMNPTLV